MSIPILVPTRQINKTFLRPIESETLPRMGAPIKVAKDAMPIVMPYKILRHSIETALVKRELSLPVNNGPKSGQTNPTLIVSIVITKKRNNAKRPIRTKEYKQ